MAVDLNELSCPNLILLYSISLVRFASVSLQFFDDHDNVRLWKLYISDSDFLRL